MPVLNPEIRYEKTAYHELVFEFPFSVVFLDFCRLIKEKYGWKEFSFDATSKVWRFSQYEIVALIVNKFPTTSVSDTVRNKWKLNHLMQQEAEVRKDQAMYLKEKKETDFVPNNVKNGEKLYGYQRVGTEFLLNANGRAILADEMGCISGDAIVSVFIGNAKKEEMKLSSFYEKFSKDAWHGKKVFLRSCLEGKVLPFHLNQVMDVLDKGKKDAIRITVQVAKEKKSIILTPDHKVLVARFGNDVEWVEASSLTIGEEVFMESSITPDSDEACSAREIVSIDGVGKHHVYDVVMDDPDRNFIANGFIVHNCGKSLQSLAYVAHENFSRVLVVCPATVKYSWYDEVEKWTRLKPVVIDSKTPSKVFRDPKKNVFIVNYDLLRKFVEPISVLRWDAIIFDESHMIKSLAARRTKAAMFLARSSEHVLFLSGTPVMNRPSELFVPLNILHPKEWGSWMSFSKKFCGGHMGMYGWDSSGSTNIDELRKRIAPYFLRRKKEDVLDDLPEKLPLISVPVELSEEAKADYVQAEEDLFKFLVEKKKKTSKEALRSLQAKQLVKLNVLRQIASAGKLKSAISFIEDVIENGEKIVVFSSFVDPIHQLGEYFGSSAVTILGETADEERRDIVKAFQNDPEKKIFLGGIKSANTGITLTNAHIVLFLDFSWCPSDASQAEARCHRIGQKNPVSVYQFFSKGTIDEVMKNIISSKDRVISKLVDGTEEAVESTFANLVLSAIERKMVSVDK